MATAIQNQTNNGHRSAIGRFGASDRTPDRDQIKCSRHCGTRFGSWLYIEHGGLARFGVFFALIAVRSSDFDLFGRTPLPCQRPFWPRLFNIFISNGTIYQRDESHICGSTFNICILSAPARRYCIHQYPSVFISIHQYALIFTHAHQYSSIFINIHRYSPIFINII